VSIMVTMHDIEFSGTLVWRAHTPDRGARAGRARQSNPLSKDSIVTIDAFDVSFAKNEHRLYLPVLYR